MIPLVHHPGYRVSLSRQRPHEESKYAALFDDLITSPLGRRFTRYEPAPVSKAELALAHDAAYIDDIFNLTLSAESLRRIGFSRHEQLYIRPSLGTGGTLLTAKLALQHGIAANTAGGSHHAHRDFGSGFCVFNDVAVAARAIQHQKLAGTILILDLDVHQGDGTAAIFKDDPTVFTLSIHCERNFPFRKSDSDLDIGLDKGVGDSDYLRVLETTLPALIDRLRPDLVFYNSGVDVHEGDKLGHLALTDDGLRHRDRMVIELVRSRSIPLATVLGGGYGEDRFEIARRHRVLFEEIVAHTTGD